jgi:hypothetical protein
MEKKLEEREAVLKAKLQQSKGQRKALKEDMKKLKRELPRHGEPRKQWGSTMTDYHRLADRDRIRIHAESKHETIKAEAIDILIDVLHRQMSSGGTVSFDHNLARKIEKLTIAA